MVFLGVAERVERVIVAAVAPVWPDKTLLRPPGFLIQQNISMQKGVSRHVRIALINTAIGPGVGPALEDSLETLGILYLASAVLERYDAEIAVIHTDVAGGLRKFKPDIVGISSVTQKYQLATKYAAAAKETGAEVVIGGAHISASPESLTESMDVGVIGEGECAFSEIVALYLSKGTIRDPSLLRSIPNLVFRDTSRTLVKTAPKAPPSLDSLPLPARSLYSPRSRAVITARGCPFKCHFCFSGHNSTPRFMSAAKALAEIKHIATTYNPKRIYIYDDLFTLDFDRLNDIANGLQAEGIASKNSFFCYSRTDTLTPQVAAALKRMNASSVFLGLESGQDKVLEYLKPGKASVADSDHAIRILSDAGIESVGGIIIGSPHETREDMLRTLDWLDSSKISQFYVTHLTPFPGTPLWSEALGRGLVSEDMDWARLNIKLNEVANPVVLSQQLRLDELRKLYDKFLSHPKCSNLRTS